MKLKFLKTNRGGEFNSFEFAKFCEDNGIRRHLTAPYSHQQNGVGERKNWTIVSMMRALLFEKNFLDELWGEQLAQLYTL